jgi:ABC-type nitrate/sulfonate/bicarbonate transport system substrate-binding protein
MHFYLAQELYAAPLPPDDDEDIEIVRMSPDEAREKLRRGDIQDVKTALGITLAMERLGTVHETPLSAQSPTSLEKANC